MHEVTQRDPYLAKQKRKTIDREILENEFVGIDFQRN